MAIPLQISTKPMFKFFLMALILNIQTHLSISLRVPTTRALTSETAIQNQPGNEIHDLLPKYGFPRGLIPNIVKSYTLTDDGDLQIFLQHPCYVQFDQLVYYDKVVKGKLKYGSVTAVSGIQIKKLFVWVTVTGMDADFDSDMVEFHVGALSQKLPAKQFQEIPSCKNKACSEESTHPESM
uniref:DUF538 family protein n=1 Tax=Kalanchoe fedtschenkoi TaxID=63787 RepID=A0A7N0VLN2_KALFE